MAIHDGIRETRTHEFPGYEPGALTNLAMIP